MNRKVRWGVLGAADIAVKKVIPAMQLGRVVRDRRHRFPRREQGRAGGRRPRHSQSLRLV